jgi:phospholipid transport system transporter-binding protein
MSAVFQAPAQLTSPYCGQLLDALDSVLQQGDATVDFSQVTALDSSAVALLLEWRRRAQRAQRALEWAALPNALKQLISVYGVQDLLQIKP